MNPITISINNNNYKEKKFQELLKYLTETNQLKIENCVIEEKSPYGQCITQITIDAKISYQENILEIYTRILSYQKKNNDFFNSNINEPYQNTDLAKNTTKARSKKTRKTYPPSDSPETRNQGIERILVQVFQNPLLPVMVIGFIVILISLAAVFVGSDETLKKKDVDPIQTDPTQTDPIQTDSTQTDPTQTDQ